MQFNAISGRLPATPISGRGYIRAPLKSRDLTACFSKFKRHSIILNMIYNSKKIQDSL